VTASTASPATHRSRPIRVPPDVFRMLFRPLSWTHECVRLG
jgi:hypothetical protein